MRRICRNDNDCLNLEERYVTKAIPPAAVRDEQKHHFHKSGFFQQYPDIRWICQNEYDCSNLQEYYITEAMPSCQPGLVCEITDWTAIYGSAKLAVFPVCCSRFHHHVCIMHNGVFLDALADARGF